ncbi:MAG: GMC oxidoreductase, partial [Acidimicrobiales bacterium]
EWARSVARDPVAALRNLSIRRWSEETIIALVMQSLDNSITLTGARTCLGRFRLTSLPGSGEPAPRWIPTGHNAVRLLAKNIGGVPQGGWNDLFDIPMTAHLIGGAVIGASAEEGVIDAYQRVFGHPGLHVVDGSALSANLGVNPALTITAQAERAMSMWPQKGGPDPRPALGDAYVRVEAVRPGHPAVPSDAPAALR